MICLGYILKQVVQEPLLHSFLDDHSFIFIRLCLPRGWTNNLRLGGIEAQALAIIAHENIVLHCNIASRDSGNKI